MRFNMSPYLNTATEAIDFQDKSFFNALTLEIDKIRSFSRGYIGPMYTSDMYDGLFDIIKKRLGFSIDLAEGGPAIMLPLLTINHIFFTNEQREYFSQFNDFDGYCNIRTVLNKLDKSTINGTVDLIKSRVTGVYTEMKFNMYMPVAMFSPKSMFTSAEVAAIMLHELGHAFTTIELTGRLVTTNQVLSLMTKALDKSITEDEKKIMFAKGSSILRMTNEQKVALDKANTKKEITCIVLDAAIEKSVSELGKSVYDVNSCEQLADQFATRHGAGKELVIALDKLMSGGDGGGSFIMFFLILYFIVITGGLILLLLPLLVFSPDKNDEIYDNGKSRFIRIKLQNLEQLKNRDLNKTIKLELIKSNEAIDNVCKRYDDNLSFFETAAYYLRPGYRNAHKYELLQKDLERIASSDLFTASAKLSTI